MGRATKKSITAMEKAQRLRLLKEKGLAPSELRRRAEVREKQVLGIFLPETDPKKLIKELRKLKVLTPYTVAMHFKVRLSVARDLLRDLHARGLLEYVDGSADLLRIYRVKEAD